MVEKRLLYIVVGALAMLIGSWRMNISIFYRHLMSYYNIGTITVLTIGFTISAFVSIFSSYFLGFVYDRKGISTVLYIGVITQLFSSIIVYLMRFYPWSFAAWLWYIGNGVAGLGLPSLMLSINPMIMRIFSRRLDIALAIIQSSNYLALTLWSPIITKLVNFMDVFTVFLILSIVSVAPMILCIKICGDFSNVQKRKQNKIEYGDSIPKLFILLLIPIFLIALSSTMLLQFIAQIVTDFYKMFGIEESTALQHHTPFAISVSGVFQTLGAFTWGFIAMRIGALKTLPLLYFFEATTMFTAIELSKHSLETAIAMLWLRFFAFGGEPVTHMLLIPTLFGQENIGKLLGMQTSVVMTSLVIGPVIGGLARDLTGSFITTAYLSALLSLVAFVAALLIVIVQHLKFYSRLN